MSYTPTEWKNGDVITAEKLNHMEGGIAAGENLVATGSYDEDTGMVTLDKTWKEIHDAITEGMTCVTVQIMSENSTAQSRVSSATYDGEFYVVSTDAQETYATSSADGYPGYEY